MVRPIRSESMEVRNNSCQSPADEINPEVPKTCPPPPSRSLFLLCGFLLCLWLSSRGAAERSAFPLFSRKTCRKPIPRPTLHNSWSIQHKSPSLSLALRRLCASLTGVGGPASTPPVQRHRPAQRMFPCPLQPSLLQREIPLRRLIRIVDQHQPRIEPQPLRLLNHRLLVLPYKPRPKKRSNRSYKWHPIKNIPRRAHINPASRSRNRRHRSQTRKPLLPSPDRLIPSIRQHKINLRRNRLAINSQQLIRRRVRARSMRRHPKSRISPIVFAVVQRLKVLLLLMNARPAPPPPRLMHKRPMCRVHQPDNPVIHIARQLRRQMCRAKPRRKLRHLRHNGQLAHHPAGPRLWQVNPRIPVALLTRKRTRKNLRRVQRFMARQRRNLSALPRTRLKPPPMIFASHRVPIEPTRRQRNPPVRTKIPHRKQLSIILPPHQQRHSQQHRLRGLLRAQLTHAHRRIPIPKDQLRRRPRHLRNSHQLAQARLLASTQTTTRPPIIAVHCLRLSFR
jgi:hypothetical protein